MGPIAATTHGKIEGAEVDGAVWFRGVPFAAPPVGPLRFRAPQPPVPWDDVRDATVAGPASLQNPSPMDLLMGITPEASSEDCLYLNVCTPALDDARRPVLVWIHGGGFIMGSGSFPWYDGASFARRGDCVFVSGNYRLGELGFLHLDHLDPELAGSGNNGILDQVAVLEWVRDNIEAFGGDPDNVTIFGESAGGMSVGTLLAVPRARGLFGRAVAQSGACHNVSSAEHAAAVTDKLLADLGVGTVAELREVPTERLLAARGDAVSSMAQDLAAHLDGGAPLLPYQPVVDGVVVPEPPLDVVRAGGAVDVELLVGTTLDEAKMFLLMDAQPLDRDGLVARAGLVDGDGEALVAAYEAAEPGLDPKALFGEIATDYVFRMPAARLAEAQVGAGGRVHTYLFSWASRAFGGMLGACHAIEVPFVFHSEAHPASAMFLGVPAEEVTGLADAVQDAWIAFARTGSPAHGGLPAWPAYDVERRPTMELGDECRLVEDPQAARRRLWEGRI